MKMREDVEKGAFALYSWDSLVKYVTNTPGKCVTRKKKKKKGITCLL